MKPTTVLALCIGAAATFSPSCAPLPAEPPEEEDVVVPGWKWSTAEVDETVNQVRAGKNLSPDGWPGGARVAVLLSFDVDNETIALRYVEPTIGTRS